MKVVINACYGRFGLSDAGMMEYARLKGVEHFAYQQIKRDDPDLIKVVEELGDKVNTFTSKLKIIEIPDDVAWEIEVYDGKELVSEKHRIWDGNL
jgi:hypothetical protein